jgi:peroxiredoxin
MRSDIVPGGIFPDYELPDHTGTLRKLSELQGDDPLILTLARGHYCPKEHQQHLELAAFYPKIAVAYTQIATIATDDHHTLQEFRASVGAQWTFLSDPDRTIQKDLDIQEYTDPEHNPMIPHTLVLKPGLVIYSIYNGYWFWGRPSVIDLWHDLRAVTSEIRPDWDLSTPGLREAWNAGDFSRFHGWNKRWKRPARRRKAPPESFSGATVAAIRYVRHSPAILTVLLRTGVVMFFSSALFALLPTVSRSVNQSATGYGLLLGCFGGGAIIGALVMQSARDRWSMETIVSTGVVSLGLVILAMSGLHRLSTLAAVMLVGGAAWVIFISLISALIQNLAPDWVRARVLAIFILVYQGTYALGTAAWGAVAQRSGVGTALVYAGIGTIATAAIALLAQLPDSTADLSPWNHWRMPVVIGEVGADVEKGPVLVTVEYAVIEKRTAEFVDAMHEYGRIRRRDGAYRWAIFRDTEVADRYLEIFLVNSWAEHLRQHERQTQADRELEQRINSCLSGEPMVRHLIDAWTEPIK